MVLSLNKTFEIGVRTPFISRWTSLPRMEVSQAQASDVEMQYAPMAKEKRKEREKEAGQRGTRPEKAMRRIEWNS